MDHDQHSASSPISLWRSAVQATLHCLTGCAIGEVLGMVLATALGWGNATSIAVSIALAFFFGYTLTIRPVLNSGLGFRRAAGVALASDTLSITTMEIIDNAFILLVPGALAAGLGDGLFWWSLALSLAIAFGLDRAREPLVDRARSRPRSDARTPRAPVTARSGPEGTLSEHLLGTGLAQEIVGKRGDVPRPRRDQ